MSACVWRLMRVAYAGALALCATAVQAEPLLVLDATRVEEQNRKDILVSGNWLVGIHTAAVQLAERPSLLAYMPASWRGQAVCARTTTINGRYFSLLRYEIPDDWAGGLVALEFETEFEPLVAAADADTSGVAIHKGDCRTVSHTFIPAHWNVSEQPIMDADGNIRLILNINGGRSDRLVGSFALDGTVEPMACARLAPAEDGASYNYRCTITIPASTQAQATITVQRFRSGRSARPREALIDIHPVQ